MSVGVSRRGFVLSGATMSLAGCAAAPVRLAGAPAERWPGLEPLLGVNAGASGLTLRVRSNGCAAKADFVFRVDRQAGQAVVAFARRRLETCKGTPSAADLAFSYEELGLTRADRIVIANPVLRPSA